MILFEALDAFYLEHRRCGELDSEVTEGERGWVVMACSCGGLIAHPLLEDGDQS